MDLQNKKILLTGAWGFIGSHLVEELVRLGATVKAFVRYNSRNDWDLRELLLKDKLNQIEVIMGDLRDVNAVRRVRLQDSEVERLWCDNTKAKRLLGWEPITSSEKGIKEIIVWISEYINLYKPELYNR